MVEINKINGGGVNCYLVTEGENSILIDTGRKGSAESVYKACRNRNVKLIVLTHGHIDHVENAAYLSEKLKAPVAMNRKDMVLLKDGLCRKMKSQGFLGNVVRFFSEKSAENVKIPEFKVSVYLKEGDNLSEYGVNAKVIELPGHTDGSIGIQVNDKDLIVGDALMNMFTPSVSLLYEDREKMLLSAKKIENFKGNKIYFGHGNPVMNKVWFK